MSTNNKIALVTGGSRGLGKDMALRLAEKGNDVIITYQSQKEAAEAVVAQIESQGSKAMALPLDVSDFSSLDGFVQQLTATLQSKWGVSHFDFLINNAGMGATIPFAQATEADFDQFMNVHFKSVYFLIQKTLPMLNDGGRVEGKLLEVSDLGIKVEEIKGKNKKQEIIQHDFPFDSIKSTKIQIVF